MPTYPCAPTAVARHHLFDGLELDGVGDGPTMAAPVVQLLALSDLGIERWVLRGRLVRRVHACAVELVDVERPKINAFEGPSLTSPLASR